jgi:hypothetical protein
MVARNLWPGLPFRHGPSIPTIRPCLGPAAPPWAACQRGGWSPWTHLTVGQAGAVASSSNPRRPCRRVPRTCPKYRSPAVTNGQQRSVVMPAELHQEPSIGGPRVLPKLPVSGRGVISLRRLADPLRGGLRRPKTSLIDEKNLVINGDASSSYTALGGSHHRASYLR